MQVTGLSRQPHSVTNNSYYDEILNLDTDFSSTIAGADYVVMPHFLGGEHASRLIDDVRRKKIKLHEAKEDHIEHLRERKDIGHEHPK